MMLPSTRRAIGITSSTVIRSIHKRITRQRIKTLSSYPPTMGVRCSSSSSSSVSQDEVQKFSIMADSWWDHTQNPLISMNPARIARIQHVLQSSSSMNNHQPPLTNKKALDVGCGGGLLSESLARLGANVTAIDPSTEIANAAQRHSHAMKDERLSKIDYRGGTSVEDLTHQFSTTKNDELYDVICILEVIEHASNPSSLLKSAASLLKKPSRKDPHGGTLFISTLNRNLKSYLFAIVGAEHIARVLPQGTHDWNKFLMPEEVERMVKPLHLDMVDLCGLVLKPQFTSSCRMQWGLDESDTDVNWIGAYRHNSASLEEDI